jgi:hypothetical protein
MIGCCHGRSVSGWNSMSGAPSIASASGSGLATAPRGSRPRPDLSQDGIDLGQAVVDLVAQESQAVPEPSGNRLQLALLSAPPPGGSASG